MNDLKFEISQVHAGWFVCLIGDVEIWASYIQMHDSPRQLLKLLGELMSGAREQGSVVFDEEPGCYILTVQRGERCSFSLGFTEKNFLDFYPEYPDGAAVLPELPRMVGDAETLLLVDDLDLYGFACAVGDAFSAYFTSDMREQYAKHWMPFPQEELLELRCILGHHSSGLQRINCPIDR